MPRQAGQPAAGTIAHHAKRQSKLGQLVWLWLSALVIVLDQASKHWFEHNLSLYEQIAVIPDLFSWTLAYNKGAAFSFLAEQGGWQRWFFALVAAAASAVIFIWMKRLRSHERWLGIALALVLGGALGNLYDRVVLGHVVDFILVHWQDRWFFPAFNIADSAITVGAGMLILDMLINKETKTQAGDTQ